MVTPLFFMHRHICHSFALPHTAPQEPLSARLRRVPADDDSIFDLAGSLLYFAAAKSDPTVVRLLASLSGAHKASVRYNPGECPCS